MSTLTYGSIPRFILVINRELKQHGKTKTKMSATYSEGDENVKKSNEWQKLNNSVAIRASSPQFCVLVISRFMGCVNKRQRISHFLFEIGLLSLRILLTILQKKKYVRLRHFGHLPNWARWIILLYRGHPTTVFCKISVRRAKYCLEFSITWGRIKISIWPFPRAENQGKQASARREMWPFHSCLIFEA